MIDIRFLVVIAIAGILGAAVTLIIPTPYSFIVAALIGFAIGWVYRSYQ